MQFEKLVKSLGVMVQMQLEKYFNHDLYRILCPAEISKIETNRLNNPCFELASLN